jgi:hypothetical protein
MNDFMITDESVYVDIGHLLIHSTFIYIYKKGRIFDPFLQITGIDNRNDQNKYIDPSN